MDGFVDVLAVGDVAPGTMAAVDIAGNEVAIANVGGTCFAFGNVCPHGNAPLNEGELDGTILTCPWHQSRFDVTTGAVIDGFADEPIPTYAVKVEGDRIFVAVPE